MSKVGAYLELTKPRLSGLAVFAVVAGGYMAWSPDAHPPFGVLAATTVGNFLVAGGANALNMSREHEYDALMARTAGRPVPSGRLTPGEAFAFGVLASIVGLVVQVVFNEQLLSGLLAAGISALILLSYVLVYTPMKRTTPLNTLVGAIPGALPPVVGYAAVRGEVGFGAVVLFAILFCWQIPHFLPIAWRYREEYARGGFRMLPSFDPDGHRTRMTMLLYVAGLGIASLIPFVTGMAGQVYLGTAVCLDLFFFVPATIAALTRLDSAMRMTFLASIVYLPLLLVVMVLDRQVPL
ncbi:MAG: Protoheme farnesyltransferase 2 [Planctomycetota bacterium]|jgi:protoheme IX farnesyltransferase